MGNPLYQQARKSVMMAKNASENDRQNLKAKAKNALSSAYANSTAAEQQQLHQLQDELESL
ncbi:hypothetical protein JOC86_003050 [Bacillus pakistanensis]|uniref:DUF3813 domain-containing protein n=1 Tax=Rossellomorea pakistanensis TaxID=992288 RepID=A0ABS2NF61_9BACI|nr:DUF3813 domain-containing protein [Bacillus pakistanensis]MBM7586498.1 hypothetical protein [Bacillus pakistanensis]